MTTSSKPNLLKALVLFVVISSSSCVRDGGLSPRALEGEWQIVSLDGEEAEADEAITWDFGDDGDFEWCYEYDSYSDCYDGDWEWNRDCDVIYFNIEEDGDSYLFEFEVDVLDKTTLKGDWGYGGDNFEIELKKL